MAKAAVFRRNLQLFVDRTLSPAAQSARLAQAAKAEVARLIATGRASPNFIRFVDGVEGAPEESVKPANDGAIVYRFPVLGRVCMFALTFLVERSPQRSQMPINEKTGKIAHFRDGFYFGISRTGTMDPPARPATRGAGGRFISTPPAPAPAAGGRFVPADQFNPALLTADVTEIVIGNRLPYNRKINIQMIGQQRLEYSVLPGLYADAVAVIRGRYGSIVDVRWVYSMEFPGKYVNKYTVRLESPALIITPRR